MSQSTPNDVGHDVVPETLTESEYHRLVAAPRRRTVLAVLDESRCPINLDELASAVADREGVADTASAVEEIHIDLHHVHLPKMDALGVLSYDPDASRVESRP